MKTVEFILDYDRIALYDVNMHQVVEPGLFEVFLGDLKGEFRVIK